MDETPGEDPDSTGFEHSRRTVLKSAAAMGGSVASAGCLGGLIDSGSTESATPTSEQTPTTTGTSTPTATPEPVTGLVDDGLQIVESELLSRRDRAHDYLRVVVRNELDHTIGVAGIMADFFDPDLAFLEVQQGTVSDLHPDEAFEGYLAYAFDDVAAYVVRADRTRRRTQPTPLTNVTVTDHCRDDTQVRGTVSNEGSEAVPRLRVRTTFYGGSRTMLGSAEDTVTGLDGNAESTFGIDLGRAVNESETVSEYAVSVGDFDEGVLAVR